MTECVLLKGCLFFNDKLPHMPALAEFLKQKYCKGDNSNCARFIVFEALGREYVSQDFFPDDIEKANKIINMHKK